MATAITKPMEKLRTKPMTAEELLAMPDDGYRYELVRGELVKRLYAGMRYANATMRITLSLYRHLGEDALAMTYPADTGFQIETNPDHVRAPCVAFVGQERMRLVENDDPNCDRYFPGPPDLAVEVVIPSDTYFYIENKVADWMNAGAGMVVVVNADLRTVRVHHSLTNSVLLTESDTLDGGDVVPGWRMDVADIFA